MNHQTELIKKCLKGDPSSQKRLYDENKDRLFAVCLRYCESHAEAQDVMQDGFIKIFRDLKNYKPIAPLYAWMRTVVVRTALENIRRKKSRVNRGVPVDELYDKGVLESVSGELAAQELMTLVQGLNDDLRAVFNLYAIDGYSHKEIAEMLKISEGNSKVRLSRARKLLKEQVERLFELK